MPGSTRNSMTRDELRQIGVIVGSGGGSQDFTEEQYRLFYTGHVKQCSVYTIPTSTIGTLASEVSMRFGLRGMSHIVSTGCTSSTDAIGYAFRNIQTGVLPTMVAGGVDSPIAPLILRGFQLMRIMSTRWNHDPQRASRPFSRFGCPRRALRLVVPARGHDAHQLEAAQDQRRDRRIHAARHHRVQHARLNMAERVADGVGGRGAARGDDVAQAAKAEPHGDFAGQRADGAGGDGVHAALLDEAGVEEAVLLFREILAAAAGADDHADPAQFVARHGVGVEARIRHRFGHAGRRQRHGARDVRAVLDLDVLLLVELVGTSPATCTWYPDGSKRVMRRTPLTPFRVASQKRSRPIPFGLTAPIPVITTRRMDFTLPLVFAQYRLKLMDASTESRPAPALRLPGGTPGRHDRRLLDAGMAGIQREWQRRSFWTAENLMASVVLRRRAPSAAASPAPR